MNEGQKQLYAYLKDNGLTDLDSNKFFSAYSDPSKSKEIHAYLKQQGLTDLDANAFHVAYFSPDKKKSTTGSQSVQPKKPTSSATMPSWMQSSLESSVKKEEKPKKPAAPQVAKNSELNKNLQAEKIASMAGGGTAGISGVGAINATPKKEEAPDFDVYYGYPGQEKNEYRISNGRWERKYGDKWVEVTNQGSISSLTKFFDKEKEITVDAVFTGFPGKEENKYRISELQNGQKVWEVQRVGQKDYTVISDQGSIDALNRQFDAKIEYVEDAQSKREAQINRRESAVEDFKTVTGKLTGMESDEVANYLTKMYGDRGFTFQPTGLLTDNIRVYAKGTDKTETFVLDNIYGETDSAEALKLRKFLSENQQLGDYIDIEREEKKKAKEDIVGTQLTKEDLNNQMARLTGAGSQAEFELAKKKNVEENITKGLNQQSTDVIEARKTLIRAEYDTNQRIDDLTRTAKTDAEKQEVAAIAVANKDEFVKKNRVDNAYLNDLNQASKAIDGSFKQLNSDVEEFNRYIKDNNITQDQLEGDPDLLAQKQDLQVRYDQLIADAEDLDFDNKKIPFIQQQNSRNAALYFAYNETRGSVIGGVWNGFLRGALGSLQTFRLVDKEGLDAMVEQFGSYTTKEFAQSENRGDFSKALLSTSESLGAAAAAFATGGLAAEGTVANKVLQFIPYFSVSYNEMKNEIDAIPGMNKAPWYKKEALAIAYGIGVGYLDKLSTNFQLKSKISNKIGRDLVLRSIAGLPKGATAEAIEMAIASNFKKDLAAGVIKVVAGSVVEGVTEGVQSAYGTGLKEAYDWMNNVDEFDSREWASQAFEEAYYGALGGAIMSTPSTLIQGVKNGFGRLDPNDMELARKVIEDSNMRSMVITDIKSKLMSGEITKDQANEQIEAINESMSLFTKIPNDLSAEDTSKSMDLIKERSNIEKQISGKDESLVAPQKARIAEINNELTKISEDATKKSTEQQQEVTAEGGGIQRERVDEGQPEVGQGEGGQRETTQQGADLGNRPVEGRSQEEIDARVSELETMLADDAVAMEETGTGSLLPEAKTEIKTELEALKVEVPVEVKTVAPKITETTDTKSYSEALSSAKAELKAEGKGLDLQVSDVSQEEADAILADGGNIFMTEDGLAGAYVKKDGYMGGLFKSPKATYKNVSKLLQQARIKVGGRFMDAYATELENIYVKNGFRPVARLKFNEEYAPEGWDAPGSALASKPDVVFFAYDPEGKYKIGDGEYVTDYDAAYDMAKNFDAKTANEADKLAAMLEKKATVSEGVISKEEVSKRVSLAQKALNTILPDVKFVVHDTDESFRKAVGEMDMKEQSSAGAYDMGSKTIHVNSTKANKRTVSHEVFHAIIISKASSDVQLQKLTKNMVNAVIKSLKQTGTNQNVIDYLDKFASNYEENLQNEEKLAELHGILGENMIDLPLPTQNIIKRFLDRIAKMFGLKEMTDREAVEFMNTMSSKVETGTEITANEFNAQNQIPGGDSFVGTVNVPRKSKGIPAPSSKDDSRDFIRNIVEDVDIREFNGEKFVTNMYDYTNAGETDLGNGLIINLFGGKNYVPYMMSINNKKIGDVSNLAAFNTKAQAETFVRNSKDGGARLFAPHSGTKKESWQFQQHTFAELVNLIIKNKLLTNAELIDTFNKTFENNSEVKNAFNIFKERYGKNIKNLNSFQSDPMQIVNLLDIKNNFSPDLRKALNNSIAANKKFQKALGVNNKNEFYNRIMDPLNNGIEGYEIMSIVDFDPNTFEIVQTSPNDTDHHPSFGWTLMAKINGVYQPTEFYKSIDITDTYTKYNKKGTEVSIKANEPRFEQKNVSTSAGAIPKVAEFNIRKQKPLQPEVAEKLTEDGNGNYVFNHYSDKKRDVIKPGTGQNIITSREEGNALSAVGGIAQYYTMDMQKEMGTGPNQHTILIPKDRVYYFNKDQEGFYDEAKRRFEEVRPGQAFNPNYQVAFITQVANDNGYDMVVANWRNGELRAQTTIELTPSDKNIQFKPLKEVTYEVGDTIEVYGTKAKITDIDGDIITFKGETTGGSINFKRSPKSIQKVATPKEQVEEEVKSLDDEMKSDIDTSKFRKQKSEIYKEELDDNDINSLRRSLRMKDPNGFIIELLDELQKAKKDESLSVSDEVNDMLENGITLSTIKGMLIDEEVFSSGKEVDNYFVQIGGDKTKGIFNRLAGLKSESETDKSKFRKQKASKQAAVIVKTGKEAGLSDAGIREYMKRNGYTDRQAIDAIQAYNDKKEGIFIDPEWSSLRKAAVLFKRKYFVSRGLLANTVFASNEARLAIIAKQLNIAQKLIVDFDRELEVIRKNSVAQYKKDVRAYINGDPTVNLPAEIKSLIDKKTGIKDRIKLASAINKLAKENVEKYRADFDAYIRDKAAVLPLELKKIADSMRAHIDSISRELISNGLIDEHLAERVIDNLGSYLNRSYKIYDRKNWKKEIEKEVKQKAINFLKIQLRPIAEEQAKKDNRDVEDTLNDLAKSRVEKYLSQQEEDMTLFSSGGKLGSKNLSTLKAREEIPVEIRMLMGEYTDPGQNYARTILKMSALAANHQFLNEVKKAGTGVFLFDKNDSKTPEGYNYEIAAEGSETMNPLNGMYTSKELKEAFEKEVSQLGKFMTFYMNILSRVKWGKTIMSPATHLKNVIGNIGFVLVNGHWRINEMAGAYKAVRDDIRSLDKKDSRAYINKLIELGIVKQGAGMGEIRAMFEDASWEETMLNNINKNTSSRWGKIKSGWNKFARGAENVYQAEDDFYKVFAYENELSRYSKAMFGKSKKELTPDERAEVDKVVAEIVKNTYPTYSRIPEAVNMIRRFPFIGNFISFQAESYRTAYMTAQLALEEIKSDNPKIRQIGAQRLTGALLYKSIKLGILSYYSSAAGMGAVGILGYFFDDDEEKQKEDDVRKFLPEWSTNSDLVVKKASDGKIVYIDMSASDPHGGINKVINSVLLGETSVDSFINGLGSIVEPFVGEEMTTAALLALKNNENAYGKPIYNPEDTFYEKSKDITGFMFNVVQPGAVASGRRVYNAESVTEEVVGATTGVRTYDIDVAENFGYQMIKYEERIDNANKIYTSEVNNDEATEKSIANAKKRAEKAVTEIHAEIYDLYYSAVRLGADEDKLYNNLKSYGGMTKRTINYMFGQEDYYIKDKYPEEEE